MNFFPLKRCYNHCPYCLAQEFMDKKNETLSRENALEFIAFLRRNKRTTGKPLNELNIMGGEPMLYKDLAWLINKIQGNRDLLVGRFTIFTGGNFPARNLELLDGLSDVDVCLNLNEKKIYHSDEVYERIITNLEAMIDKKGLRVGLGYNIASLDFNGDEIIATAKKFGIDSLRIAIASPIYGSDNPNIVHPEQYKELSPKVFQFVKKCHANGIDVNLDCTVPYCFFTDSQCGWFTKHNQRSMLNGIRSCACGFGPLCISPTLQVSKCTVLDKISTPLKLFSSAYEIYDTVLNSIDYKFGTPDLYPKCATCPHRTRCSGGCPAWKKGFLDGPDRKDITDKLVGLFEENISLYWDNIEKKDDDMHAKFLENEKSIREIVKNLPEPNDTRILHVLYLYYNRVRNYKKRKYYYRKCIHHGGAEEFFNFKTQD